MRSTVIKSIVPKLVAVGLASAMVLVAYKDGPPADMAGGFGGETCVRCHSGNPLNAPGGSLRIEGLPEKYRAGVAYVLTVVLAREGLYTAGFQLTSRGVDGAAAGSWRSLDDRTQVVGTAIQQTLRGARVPAEGENRWRVEWTPPPAGEVVMNGAGNASNDDASPLGDSVYTIEARVAAGR